jgi:predicted transcriptional regulator
MQIDLPQDLTTRIQKRALMLDGISEVEVIRKALDSMDWLDQERQAIEAGINDWRAGNVRDFESFDREFCQRNGIAPQA